MKNTEKKALLEKEFKALLEQANKVANKCCDEMLDKMKQFQNTDPQFEALSKVQNRSARLTHIISDIWGEDEFDTSFTSEKLEKFKASFSELFASASEEEGDNELDKTDVMSKHLTVVDRLLVNLAEVLRGMFRVFDVMLGDAKFAHFNEPKLGETPFALKWSGQSQFVPRPIKSLNDAKLALEDISNRLDTCIEDIDNEMGEEEDDSFDPNS